MGIRLNSKEQVGLYYLLRTQWATLRVIFKGGTPLSKGWNLIQRFSEDIGLFLDLVQGRFEELRDLH